MKKILWLCNVAFSEQAISSSGTWLQPMAMALQQTGKIQIYNITLGYVDKLTESNCFGIRQWVIPLRKTKKHRQIPNVKTCEEIRSLVQKIQPVLIHIWGTERLWASVYRLGYIKSPALLEIQGILSVTTDFYFGGLSFSEILQCVHLKEILLPWRNLFYNKKVFKIRGEIETENIRCFQHVSYQSDWTKRQLSIIHPDATHHASGIILRDAFYSATPWQYKNPGDAPVIFSSSSGAYTHKGLQVLFKAIMILKKKYPNIRLNIAGNLNSGNWLLNGFSIFLENLIKKFNLKDNICYLGPLNADQIVLQLQSCHVCAVPSFIESYCLGFAEALILGTPTVVSFTGAMPELAAHRRSAMFYNPLDHRLCAVYINQLIQDKELAESLSCSAREIRLKANDPTRIVDNQIRIYDSIINE